MKTTNTENKRKVELFKYTNSGTDYYIIVKLNERNECVSAKMVSDYNNKICLETMRDILFVLYGHIEFYDASSKESDSDYIYKILNDFIERNYYKFPGCNREKDPELWNEVMDVKINIRIESPEEREKRKREMRRIKEREEYMARVKSSGFVDDYTGAKCQFNDIMDAYNDYKNSFNF